MTNMYALAKVLWLQSACKKMNAMESYQSLKVKGKIDFDKPKSKEACFFLYFIFSSHQAFGQKFKYVKEVKEDPAQVQTATALFSENPDSVD